MWETLSGYLNRWRQWRIKAGRAAPRAIEAQAREVAHLAMLAELAVMPGHDMTPLRLLREEMEALAMAAQTQEFIKLSLDRRFMLAERLDRTQQFILTTLQEGQPPTPRKQ